MDFSDVLKHVLDAGQAGNWKLASAFLVILLVLAIRKWGPKLWKPLGAGTWAVVVAVATAAALAVVVPYTEGQSFGGIWGVLSRIVSGVITGLVAAGVVKGWKEVTSPKVEPAPAPPTTPAAPSLPIKPPTDPV